MQGGIWTYSPQDFMNTRERNVLIDLGIAKEYKVGMGAGLS
jgi:hypothetical protein